MAAMRLNIGAGFVSRAVAFALAAEVSVALADVWPRELLMFLHYVAA